MITVFPYPPASYDSVKYWPRYVPGISWAKVNGIHSMILSDVSGYYVSNWHEGKYAKRLAQFIDKVLTATGAQKVDIVAHSMGGLVARAAIKNYGCANKVRKLLMIGTPNRTFASWWEEWYRIFGSDQSWQKNGENIELGVGVFAEFTDLSTGDQNYWHNFLGYSNYIEGMSTIAGNKGRSFYGNKPNDGVVAVEQVGLSSAQFNPVIYASHSYGAEPELALTTCTYTEEFIKNWIIDDDVSHNGATVAGAIEAYDAVPFDSKWDNYELRLRLPINDYNKALVTLVEYWKTGTPYYKYYKAFPLYKYTKGCPGDPVFAKTPILANGSWIINPMTYDMDGTVYFSYDAIDVESPSPCNVEVVSPVAGEVFTVQSAWDKLTVKVKCDFYMAQNMTVWFSPGENMSFLPIWCASNFGGGGGIKTISPALPQVNSDYCRVAVTVQLDNVMSSFEIYDVSDAFTIQLNAPYDLYAFAVGEARVGLDWKCEKNRLGEAETGRHGDR